MRPLLAALFAAAVLALLPHLPALGATAATAPATETPAAPAGARIARVWHGRTKAARADAYAAYLADAIKKFRTLPGNLGYAMYREDGPAESHFMVVSYWTSRDAIHAYAGADISKTRNLPRDPEFLVDPEPTVHNYDIAAANPAP